MSEKHYAWNRQFEDEPPGEYQRDREPVFTHCNVCGRELINDIEESMGMCNACADERKEKLV